MNSTAKSSFARNFSSSAASPTSPLLVTLKETRNDPTRTPARKMQESTAWHTCACTCVLVLQIDSEESILARSGLNPHFHLSQCYIQSRCVCGDAPGSAPCQQPRSCAIAPHTFVAVVASTITTPTTSTTETTSTTTPPALLQRRAQCLRRAKYGQRQQHLPLALLLS